MSKSEGKHDKTDKIRQKRMPKKKRTSCSLEKAPKASVQQEFHCSCSARNETLVIVGCFLLFHKFVFTFFVAINVR